MTRGLAIPCLTGILLVTGVLGLPSASAAVTIGSPLPATTHMWECDGGDATSEEADFPCVLIQDTINGAYVEGPAGGGVVTGWQTRDASGTIALRVMRANTPLEPGKVKATSRNESQDEAAGGGLESWETQQRIGPGDYIGIVLQNSSSQAGYSDVAHANPTKLFEGPGVLNDDPFVTEWSSDGELLFRAFVEPDANGNGCGDQTQEHLCDTGGGGDGGGFGGDGGGGSAAAADPLAGLRAGKRPRAGIRGKRLKASKKGVVRITVSNPNGYRLKGKLTLKSGKSKLGAKAVSIGAENRKSVRIKLSGGAFRSLRRKRRMGVTAILKVRGPIGKSRTVKKKMSIKAPKIKKKKKSTGGGGGGGYVPYTPICVPHIEYDADGWAHAIPC